MKNDKNKNIFLGVACVGVLACLLVYLLVFNKYTEMTDALKSSNAALKIEVDDMKIYYDNMESNRIQRDELWNDINDILEDYTAAVKDEDAIMVAVAMNDNSVINFESINFAQPDMIHTVMEETVTAVGEEALTSTVDFYEKKVTYENETDYSNLKRAIEAIYNSPYRLGISLISYKKQSDTDRVIEGNIDVVYYSVDGLGKEYEAPDMPSYLNKVQDLFGVLYTIGDNGVIVYNVR